MKNHTNLPLAVLIVLSSVMAVVCIISLVRALSWVHKPFPGFLVYPPPYVGSISVKGWPGESAGLELKDRILTAAGQEVQKGQDVLEIARAEEPGSLISYEIESEGHVYAVSVPTAVFGIKDFLLAFLITFVGGIALFILGVTVVLFKPGIRTSWVFFAMCFTLGGYMITSFEGLSTYTLLRFHTAMLSIFPITFFHLGLTFPDKKRILESFPHLEYLIYIPAVFLLLGYQVYISTFVQVLSSGSPSWVPSFNLLGTVSRLLMLFSVLSLIMFVFHSVYRASNVAARQRARMILFGVTIAFLPSLILTLLSFFLKFYFPWNFLVFFIIFFPASIAYSIVRHNLFDADAIIKRTVGYGVVTGVVIGAYALVSVGLNVFLGKYQLAQSRAFPILFTLGVILVFNPLRNRIQSLVDRVFFRKEYDRGAILDKVGGAMTSLLDLGRILKRLTQTFIEDMFINTSSILLLNPATAEYHVSIAEGERKQDIEGKTFNSNQPLMEIIETEKRELTKYDVIEDPKYRRVSESCAKHFEELYATLMVPLVYQNQVVGSLNLGEKKSGKPYNRQDIELLHALANQGAVAIENARLFQENLEKQRMEEELNIARDLQMSMLPAICPQVKGYQIAASSTPAREVGGDFYDFIEMEDDKVGLVVADVTGKSVSGALVMSSSRSVFRMLSEERLNVGDIMTRANRRIKQDIKSGMFVALLYAVLDARKGKVLLCSAGQTQPIHRSAPDGAAKLVDTKGDNFPLGILDEADYRETEVWLPPGDAIVFYTDGIVEAMNEQEEIFGFERLLEVVQQSVSVSADALLKRILDQVNAFVGKAPQHDDLTIIIVKAP